MAVRVGIVEDDGALREALRRVVGWPGGDTVVGACAGTGKDFLEQLRSARIAVALVDLKLPDMSGIDVIIALREASPDTITIAFTVLDQPETVFAAIRAGARGYLLKSATPTELLDGIREAAQGGAPMTPVIARMVVDALGGSHGERPPELTLREREVLHLLAGGSTYAEIAEQLGIGFGTVQGYIKNLYRKLEVSSKAEAAALAVKHGILP